MAQLSHVNAWQCAPSAVSLRKTPQPFLGARVPIVTPRNARRYPRCLECWTATPSVASTRCGKQSHAGACRTGAARGMASWRPLTPELGRRSRRCLACLVRAIVCPPGGTAISHNTSRAGPCLPQLCSNGYSVCTSVEYDQHILRIAGRQHATMGMLILTQAWLSIPAVMLRCKPRLVGGSVGAGTQRLKAAAPAELGAGTQRLRRGQRSAPARKDPNLVQAPAGLLSVSGTKCFACSCLGLC